MTRFALLSICVLIFAAGVFAADEAKAPSALKPGDTVTGPADIKSKSGDVLKVSKGSVLEVKEPDGEIELFFIKSGTVRGSIGAMTQVAVPFGWISAPKTGKAEFYAESAKDGRTFVKVNKGAAILATKTNKLMLRAGQGVELWTEKAKAQSLCFSTRANNEGEVMLLTQVTGSLEIELLIPKATTGCIYQVEGGKRTKIESDAGSWTGGKIAIRTRLSGVEGQTGTLGPGTFALIDNATGKIEFGFVEVDFQIIKRAIDLTSEFTALATSNFFGLAK